MTDLHRHSSIHAPEDSASWRGAERRADDSPTQRSLDYMADRLYAVEQDLATMKAEQGRVLEEAVIRGVTAILKNDELMDSLLSRLLSAFSRRSVKTAGNLTLGLFREVPKTIFKYAIVGLIVYQLGGWQLVVTLFKATFAEKASGG